MRRRFIGIKITLTALVAVFLWANIAKSDPSWPPLVFSEHAGAIAKVFGEKQPENVLVVVVTNAPGDTAFVIVIMKNGHRFKWIRGPYETAMKQIRSVLEKIKNREQV